MFPNDSLVFHVWGQNFEFSRKMDQKGFKNRVKPSLSAH